MPPKQIVLIKAEERCNYGEIIAFQSISAYSVRHKTGKKFFIDPEDVMSRDCVNLGPPPSDEEITYYNCAQEDQGRLNTSLSMTRMNAVIFFLSMNKFPDCPLK